jgi:NADP-dependent 3-hydroxy acid dehydrogenase YdfG
MADVSKAVLITGCSTGIGRATAERLAQNGHTVYATARRPDSIADLEEKGCKTLALDVTDEDSMAAAVSAVEQAEGAVGALVNNAGYSQSGAIEDVPMDQVRRQFETNVFGLIRMCQLVLPGMRRQGSGRIVNLSSMGGKLVFPGGGIYHATKHAVEAISDALRFEVRNFGVAVSIIEPGLIKTEFAHAAVNSIDEATAEADGSPYASFNREVAQKTVEAYEGPMARMAAGPEAVAKVIERAITSRRPRPRYMVTAGARVLLVTRRALPDRGWDLMMRSQYPSPGTG